MLSLRISNFVGNAVKPVPRLSGIADSSPKLPDKICENRAFIGGNSVVAAKRFFKGPRCQSTEVSLSLNVIFVGTAPGGTEEKIRDLTQPAA